MRLRPLPYDGNAARRHIGKADPVMRDIVKRVGSYELEVRGAPYESLIRAILYQQLAGPAAAAIERRFLAIFGDRIPESHELIATNDGRVINGLVRAETDAYVELVDRETKLTRVAKSEIEERKIGEVSVMPAGLVDSLTRVEFADLISYLGSLRAPAGP